MTNIRSAQAILNEIRDGRALVELADAFHTAIDAVRIHGKPATVILTMQVAPFKGNSKLIEPPMLITGEVNVKLPKPDPESTIFYIDDDGNPTLFKSREPELGLSVVIDKETGEINGRS